MESSTAYLGVCTVTRKIMLAADMNDLFKLEEIVEKLIDHPKFGGVKIGFNLALRNGLKSISLSLPADTFMIYDHQKAGNDIPDMGTVFADVMRDSYVNAAILFPFAGPATLEAWIKALQEANVEPIVGGFMTHPKFTATEGGYIPLVASFDIYHRAMTYGVNSFVVPGNNPTFINLVKEKVSEDAIFYAPGLITQGGDITEAGEACGENFTAIVGRAIYEASNPVEAFEQMASKL